MHDPDGSQLQALISKRLLSTDVEPESRELLIAANMMITALRERAERVGLDGYVVGSEQPGARIAEKAASMTSEIPGGDIEDVAHTLDRVLREMIATTLERVAKQLR